jgi:4-hydroxy-4-methyl-2-oxoglutarate aldolase
LHSDVAARLVELGVATLHEANARRNLVRGIRLLVGAPFAGPAVTVAIPAGDNLGLHFALETAGPGTVVCVASAGGGVYGVLGDLLLEVARARSVAGLVIDDGIRDLDDLVAPPSVAARGVTALGAVKARLRQPVGAHVPLGGTLVAPGDWVVCDADGVCIVPAASLAEVSDRAGARIAKEADLRERLQGGVSSREAMGLSTTAPPSLG